MDVGKDYQIPDELWEKIKTLLPPPKQKKKSGRPRMDDRKAMTAIFYILRTGCQWKALPRSRRVHPVQCMIEEWREAGVFEKMWGLMEHENKKGIDWKWQSMDGAMTKAPLGGEGTGRNPTDRGKSGTKRSLLTDGNGIPLSVTVDGANRHDKKLVEGTLEAIIVERPSPEEVDICMDKGYDYPDVRELVEEYGYTAHIRSRGEEIKEKKEIPGYRARRWVVERTHSWMNRFRRLLIRWEKKVENAMLHFACSWITFRAAGLFG